MIIGFAEQAEGDAEIIQAMIDKTALSSNILPAEQVAPGDHIAGKLNFKLRKFWTALVQLDGELEKLCGGMGTPEDEEMQEAAAMTCQAIFRRLRRLYNAFWMCVRYEYNLWDKTRVGIRQDWLVVWGNESKKPAKNMELESLLETLFSLFPPPEREERGH